MTPRPLPLAALLVLASGCLAHRLDRNALGDVDVRTPPSTPSERAPVPATDPGMQGVMVIGSASAALGAELKSGRAGATHELGLAASVLYGRSRVSEGPPFPQDFDGAAGLSLGWTAEADGRAGRVWLEGLAALRSSLLRAGAGWTWETRGRSSGPQASLHAGPLVLRGTFIRGEGALLTLGVTLDPSYTVAWSR